jgi:hypothetical protein
MQLPSSPIRFRAALILLSIVLSVLHMKADTYTVDCGATANGDGKQTPWNTLTAVNAHNFNPGDQLLFKSGTVCHGQLAPLGSGSSAQPITINSYGSGAMPQITSTSDVVLLLSNQQYWEINNIEIVGGVHYGVFISGNKDNIQLHHVNLTNLNVHGATFVSTARLDSGSIFYASSGANGTWNDVTINGVSVHDSMAGEGIYIQAGGQYVWPETGQSLGSNITVQNSTVRNVAGDGILVIQAKNTVLANNVSNGAGQCKSCTGTPSGIWVWQCTTCRMEFNESYNNLPFLNGNSDGGAFDIDYHNHDVILQYNYGHDSAGYCFAIFGAASDATTNSIARYNICANNEREVNKVKPFEGDVFLSTWDGGSIRGVAVYNNTFFWNPAGDGGVLYDSNANITGGAQNYFANNLIFATNHTMLTQGTSLQLMNNLYYTISPQGPVWSWNGKDYSTLATFQNATGQDSNSLYANPLLNNPVYHQAAMDASAFLLNSGSPALGAGINISDNGGRDFFGNPVAATGPPNIGAFGGAGTAPVSPASTWTTLGTSTSSATPSTQIIFTAAVMANSGTPTGKVAFLANGSPLCDATLSSASNQNIASCAESLPAGSTATITGSYSGDANYAASFSINSATVSVSPLDFTLATSGSTEQTITAGAKVSYSLQLAPTEGSYPGAVTFSVSGLPVGAQANFSPTSLAANAGQQTVYLTIQTTVSSAINQSAVRRKGRFLCLAFLLPLTYLHCSRKASKLRGRVILAVLLPLFGSCTMIGCGGAAPTPQSIAQSYAITITATSQDITHISTVNLTVQ